jgi:hypothetical protein
MSPWARPAATGTERTGMAVADAGAWVRNVERLYQAHDAAGVAAHTCEVVEDYRDDALADADEACRVHQGTSP